ncbi:hypothetical protein ACQPVP_08745 [Clostridium nigeriense]|uniref:hypothetical protein n=1 Tax=Clostridium nigeriense TaxID=1805470 RepID=UPI003D32FBA4
MKLSNERLINSVGVLSKLNNSELAVKTSYKLSKNIKTLDKEIVLFNEEKQKLINKYAVKNEKGENKIENGIVEIADTENFNKECRELLDIEVDVKIEKINIDELAKSNLTITPGELSLIDYLIK